MTPFALCSLYALYGTLVLVVVFVGLVAGHLPSTTRDARLPPGPKPLPFIGNLFDLRPRKKANFRQWNHLCQKYGSLCSLTVLGRTIIIIGNSKIAEAVLQKKARYCSDRPHLSSNCHFLTHPTQWLLWRDFDESAKLQRRLISQHGNTTVKGNVPNSEVRRLLVRIINDPNDTLKHFRFFASAVSLKTTYGYTPELDADKTDALAQLFIGMFKIVFQTYLSWHLMDSFRWLPRTVVQSIHAMIFRKHHQATKCAFDIPYYFAKKQCDNPDFAGAFVSWTTRRLLADAKSKGCSSPELDESVIKASAAANCSGGMESTAATMSIFLWAMSLHPEAQQKAQEELDRVVGSGRLPTLSHEASLPYTNALIKETMRWFPVANGGMMHCASQDIMCEGYLIPKGAILIPVVWSLMHDPNMYRDPDEFQPERFLAPRNETDPAFAVFGFGRRKCPGYQTAQATLFLAVAAILATSTIGGAIGDQGKEIKPGVKFESGFFNCLKSFPFSISPRSEKHLEFIRGLEQEQACEKSHVHLIDQEQVMAALR